MAVRLMAALWMARCGIKARVIDKRDAGVRTGHADGIQCRTLEILESFGIVDRIWKESCHMPEVRPKPHLISLPHEEGETQIDRVRRK